MEHSYEDGGFGMSCTLNELISLPLLFHPCYLTLKPSNTKEYHSNSSTLCFLEFSLKSCSRILAYESSESVHTAREHHKPPHQDGLSAEDHRGVLTGGLGGHGCCKAPVLSE